MRAQVISEKQVVLPLGAVDLEHVQVNQGCFPIGIPPHNGFPYYYAVTWFSECLSNQRDTVWTQHPQPAILAEATAQIEVLDLDALLLELFDQQQNPLQGVHERVEAGQLGADVAIDSNYIHMLKTAGHPITFNRCIRIDTKFIFFQTS